VTPARLGPLTLRPEQQAAVDRMASEFTRAALDRSGLSSGKTPVSVELGKALGAKTTMVVGPRHTMRGWQKTFERQQYGYQFRLIGNKNKAQREAWQDALDGKPGVYFVGREFFRLKNWKNLNVEYLVVDESHTLAGKRTRSRGALALKSVGSIGYLKFNSATPFGANFEGAWSIGRLLWPTEVDSSFTLWRDKYAATKYDHFTHDKLKVTGEKHPGEFIKTLPCVINLPTPPRAGMIRESLYIQISPSERRQYAEMESDGIAWLEEHPLVADLPTTKHIRLRQIALGECSIRMVDKRKRNPDTGLMETVQVEEVYFEDDCKSSTIDTLIDLMTEKYAGRKVLVTTDSARFGKVAAKRLNKAGVKTFAWFGDTSDEQRESAKEEFLSGDMQVILAHPAAIAEGTDGLQYASNILIQLTKSHDQVLNQQLLGRLDRIGQENTVIVIDFHREGTIDDPQAETLLTKRLAMRGWIGEADDA
jgi:hypothetical protein